MSTTANHPNMNLDFEKDIFIENDKVLIRHLEATDFDHLLPIAVEDETLLQFSPKPIHTEELLSQYIDDALNARRHHQRYPFIIFDKQKNAFAGSTSFLNVSNPHRYLEIGHTWLGRSFQKTGLNRQCKYLLLDYVFNNLGFHRVELRTDERNTASRTAIEKIGGKQEGLLRSHMVMSDGFRRNTVCYGILKDEWLADVANGLWDKQR